MSTPNDREFAYWHRVASEVLIRATTNGDRFDERLATARDYGRRSLQVASTPREQQLACDFLAAVDHQESLTMHADPLVSGSASTDDK
jgi:hypothetical protein